MAVKIRLKPNGPIVLTADNDVFPVLERETGGDIELQEPAFLCRCGASGRKPFCDGSHVADGYSDENRCANDELQSYEAPGITVHFNRSICSGAAACVRGLPAVFESASENWIHPQRASAEEVMAVIDKCPSGALSYDRDGAESPAPDSTVSVRIVPDGPYEVRGPVELETPRWSRNASRAKFTLCRCGKSSNAPFCDYSHAEQGWTEDG